MFPLRDPEDPGGQEDLPREDPEDLGGLRDHREGQDFRGGRRHRALPEVHHHQGFPEGRGRFLLLLFPPSRNPAIDYLEDH